MQPQDRDARVKRGLQRIVAADGGPPGAIATLYRNGHLRVITAGVARVGARRAPRATDHMRLASVAKAFSGRVTVRQLLNHTSGVLTYRSRCGTVSGHTGNFSATSSGRRRPATARAR